MTKDILTEEKVQRLQTLHDSLSDAFLDHLAEKTFDSVNTGLMMWGDDVRDYRGLQKLARTLTASSVIWLVENGYVTLRKKALASEDELAQRKAAPTRDLNSVQAVPTTLGQYL